MSSLKEKMEWLLKGNYLVDKEDKVYAYGLDVDTNTFYAIAHYSVGQTEPNRYLIQTNLPLEDIAERMDILLEYEVDF